MAGRAGSQTVRSIRTIDAHAAGGPLRLVVEGFPTPSGKTLEARQAWVHQHASRLLFPLITEPRGHADMWGAVLTEPASPGSHAGVLFFHQEGFAPMSGHGIMAVARIAIDRGLIMPGGDGSKIVFDTIAGTIAVTVSGDRVSFVNVPARVLHAGVPVQFGNKNFRADITGSGGPYAIVDAESAGVAADGRNVPLLRLIASAATDTVAKVATISGVIFTGPPHEGGADLRTVAVSSGGVVDRSPCGMGTSGVMAVLDAMGLLDAERPFVHEGIIGTRVEGRVLTRTVVDEHPAIITEITGSAWITGEHTFFIDDRDPLKKGFLL